VTLVTAILFIIAVSLIVLGVKSIVEAWGVVLNIFSMEETTFIILITGLGMVVIGVAVLDLTRSIIEEELAERRIKNAQERARDFLTRFLAVIIFAISAEIFLDLAEVNAVSSPEFFGDVAISGIAVGAMLAGLALYLKMTAPAKEAGK